MERVIDPIKLSLAKINGSRLMAGIMMLMLNLGSRYVDVGFSEVQEKALRNLLMREILIFAMVFTATKDIVTSILMTAAFIILSDFLLNERSRFCLAPSLVHKAAGTDKGKEEGEVSEQEVIKAFQVLQKAEKAGMIEMKTEASS
jgi:hypothetical protein